MAIHRIPVAFKLSLSFDNADITFPATGSIWRRDSGLWLVSNWHVFSGRDIYTGQCRTEFGEPQAVTISIPLERPHAPNKVVETSELLLKLVDDEGNKLWRQHGRGQTIDLACLQLSEDFPINPNAILPHRLNNDQIAEIPGIDVFVMGFPRGLALQGGLPLWKRASIASEPNRYAGGLPITLVDTACREGMSGSPAFIVQYKGQFVLTKEGQLVTDFTGKPYKFVGIYSGRYGASKEEDEFKAQVGRLWWENVLFEMLDKPVSADWTNSPQAI